MKNIKEQFVTYEIAVTLKKLGFDEPCLGYFNADEEFIYGINLRMIKYAHRYNKEDDSVLAPLWQQCIDWFREKYDIDIEIHSKFGHGTGWWANLCYNPTRTEVLNIAIFDNYYEARERAILECIELLKKV